MFDGSEGAICQPNKKPLKGYRGNLKYCTHAPNKQTHFFSVSKVKSDQTSLFKVSYNYQNYCLYSFNVTTIWWICKRSICQGLQNQKFTYRMITTSLNERGRYHISGNIVRCWKVLRLSVQTTVLLEVQPYYLNQNTDLPTSRSAHHTTRSSNKRRGSFPKNKDKYQMSSSLGRWPAHSGEEGLIILPSLFKSLQEESAELQISQRERPSLLLCRPLPCMSREQSWLKANAN